MERGTIPEDILRFVADSIDSVPHLEALLLLWEYSDKVWTEEEIAQRVYISRDNARATLHDLVRRQFVTTESAVADHRYRYDPRWDESRQMMPRVADCYRRHLVGLANFIHSKASLAVRDFARAFQFKD